MLRTSDCPVTFTAHGPVLKITITLAMTEEQFEERINTFLRLLAATFEIDTEGILISNFRGSLVRCPMPVFDNCYR